MIATDTNLSDSKSNIELERLIRKPVTIKINNGSSVFLAIYFGRKNDRYLFLRQFMMHKNLDKNKKAFPTNNIVTYKFPLNSVTFYNEGVILSEIPAHNKYHDYIEITGQYSPVYKEKLGLLQSNNLWEMVN